MATARKLRRSPLPRSPPRKKPAAKKPPRRSLRPEGRPAKRPPPKKPAAKKPAAKRKPNAAFMKAMTPSATLAAGRRQHAAAAHRSDQEDLGLHQEEQAAGRRSTGA